MKIAIDVSQVVYETGVSIYTKNLVQALLSTDTKNSYKLFGGTLRRKEDLSVFFTNLNGRFEKKIYSVSPSLADLLFNRIRLFNIESFIGKVDVFHSSDWTQPRSRAFKVTTVHDLAPLKFPQLSSKEVVEVHKRRLEIVKSEANHIIAPSHSTKIDLMQMGFNPQKITVIPEAVLDELKPSTVDAILALKRKHGITGEYLLGIGINARKNTQRLINAFELLKKHEHGRWLKNLSLVLVGEQKTPLNLSKKVILTGHVDSSDLAALYSGAKVFVYPSLYEGFGLPILEAFACKTPVVTSNISSMPEAAGNAAILIDPYEVESIYKGIIAAYQNRQKLVKSGLGEVQKYSWLKTAKKTLEVYNLGRNFKETL